MQRKSYFKTLLSGVLYLLFASALCTVMTVASAPFLGGYFAPTMKIILVVFTAIIYFSLIFTVAWKDGQEQRKYLIRHKDEQERNYWLSIGVIMALIASLPSLILLFSRIAQPSESYFMIFKLICGPIYSWILLLVPENGSSIILLSPIAPLYFIVYYMFIPVFAKIGFYVGFNDKLNQDKIMYK